MAEVLKTVLLLALPASGKSEVRRYLNHLKPEQRAHDFHMGPTVQLDDFPYVHLMRRIDDELAKQDQARLFFVAPDKQFIDPRDWGTLIQLLNEDYDDLVNKQTYSPTCHGYHLFDRIDAASQKVGFGNRLATLDPTINKNLADALSQEAAQHLVTKQASYPDTLDGKTLVLEFARGGSNSSDMPLPSPWGYRYSISQLSEALLKNAAILYVWVTPEESRRKNADRTDPNDPGSILHHGVPIDVMLGDYGCDDLDWLQANSEKEGTITIEAHGKNYHIPVGRFDNRIDKTSFLREDAGDWNPDDVKAVHQGLKLGLDKLV